MTFEKHCPSGVSKSLASGAVFMCVVYVVVCLRVRLRVGRMGAACPGRDWRMGEGRMENGEWEQPVPVSTPLCLCVCVRCVCVWPPGARPGGAAFPVLCVCVCACVRACVCEWCRQEKEIGQ